MRSDGSSHQFQTAYTLFSVFHGWYRGPSSLFYRLQLRFRMRPIPCCVAFKTAPLSTASRATLAVNVKAVWLVSLRLLMPHAALLWRICFAAPCPINTYTLTSSIFNVLVCTPCPAKDRIASLSTPQHFVHPVFARHICFGQWCLSGMSC